MSAAAAIAAPADALKVVLFGMPDAGKSSLLGALAQASQTQERALHGKLTDLSSGLAELQQRVYDDRPRETLDEIVPYPVTFDPLVGGKPDPRARLNLVLIDCDGRAANEILTQQKKLGAGGLGSAVLDADALVLVVDASASVEQMESDFAEFRKFLRMLERHRGRQSAIGGLPVYLVLSKRDLLPRPGENNARWVEEIEAKKKQVHARFQEFLAREDDEEPSFGTIDLKLGATAVKRPSWLGGAAQPREPVGVAELFRSAIGEAQTFRDRGRRSTRRLTAIVAGVVGTIALMGLGAFALLMNRDTIEQTPLVGSVESYRSREGQTPSARLSEPLQRKISELKDLKQHPDFAKLSPDLRTYVDARLMELQDYAEYRDKLNVARPPSEARSDEELAECERRLKEELALPKEHANEWGQTDAALLRAKWLEDIEALRGAVGRVEEWYRDLRREAEKLLTFSDRPGTSGALPWTEWQERAEKLLVRADQPPFRLSDKLPNSRSLSSSRPALTYATAFAFAPVESARSLWEKTKAKLERVRDLTTALGLAGDLGEQRSPLKIPEPPRFRAEHARERLASLKRAYPRSGEWSISDLPDAVAPEVRAAAKSSARNLIAAGQQLVSKELQSLTPDNTETHGRWLAIADWLTTAPELKDWRTLAVTLMRLSEDRAEDPAVVLATFLREKSFELEFRSIGVEIPDDLKAERLRPADKLTIFTRPGGQTTTTTFRLEGDPMRDARRRVTVFRFVPDGAPTMTLKPGDEIWAELPVRDARNEAWKFVWSDRRSDMYYFERLSRAPVLVKQGQDAGDLAEGVILSVLPERGIPRVPDLLPNVRRR